MVLSACAQSPVRGDAQVQQSAQLKPVSVGDTITLDRPVQGVNRVVVHSIYVAASGRTCRRLATEQGQLLAQRSCRNKDGDWYISRRLSAAEPFMLPVASEPGSSASNGRVKQLAGTTSALESVSRQMTTVRLTPGETLWAFAARVTGNALNWQRIAADNDIADARDLAPQQSLSVQTSLVRADQ